ncbi:MAG: hypothetical protein VX589_21225, partial [Myxococcota bacterium]|nr:hypothetical protein [Myxococcota bacterium]
RGQTNGKTGIRSSTCVCSQPRLNHACEFTMSLCTPSNGFLCLFLVSLLGCIDIPEAPDETVDAGTVTAGTASRPQPSGMRAGAASENPPSSEMNAAVGGTPAGHSTAEMAGAESTDASAGMAGGQTTGGVGGLMRSAALGGDSAGALPGGVAMASSSAGMLSAGRPVAGSPGGTTAGSQPEMGGQSEMGGASAVDGGASAVVGGASAVDGGASAVDGGIDSGGSPIGGAPNQEFRDGPTPYMAGMERLSFGVFYEGGHSKQLILRPPNRDLQVFVVDQQNPANSQTVRIVPVDTALEGFQADEFVFQNPWFGATILYTDEPEDLTGWTTLHVALKSSDPSALNVRISVNGIQVGAQDYGFQTDGQWHRLAIPLVDFSTMNQPYTPNQVDRPFGLHGENCVANEKILVDNFYYAKDGLSTRVVMAPADDELATGGQETMNGAGERGGMPNAGTPGSAGTSGGGTRAADNDGSASGGGDLHGGTDGTLLGGVPSGGGR